MAYDQVYLAVKQSSSEIAKGGGGFCILGLVVHPTDGRLLRVHRTQVQQLRYAHDALSQVNKVHARGRLDGGTREIRNVASA